MKKLLQIFLLLLISSASLAQTATIFGTVKTEHSASVSFVNVTIPGTTTGTITDSIGNYKLQIPADSNIRISYSFIGFLTQTHTINLKEGEQLQKNIELKELIIALPETVIKGEKNRENTETEIEVEETKKVPSASGGVEEIIKSQPGVSSGNELSSQYSVRGGNFDENLVYVNDIEVYRPFLIRSGQQEGLSFVNPDLTKNILFSAGGFDARYGDKMSSVLDITYKQPKEFKGSVTASLLGGAFHLEGINKNNKFTYLVGSRYKTNKILLNTLPTKGEYNPTFLDFQSLIGYKTGEKSKLEFLSNFSLNKFRIIPESSLSTFGTTAQTLQLRVAFEGEEADQFLTSFSALKYTYYADSSLTLNFIGSAYNSQETEAFDIEATYFLDELDPANSGNNINKGIGAFRRHARNDLNVSVLNFAQRGKKIRRNNKTEWELKYQKEIIEDDINQWQITDSAGYTIPLGTNSIAVQNAANAKNSLNTNRFSGFVQQNWTLNKQYTLIAGVRANYWDFTKEFLVAPRATISNKPKSWKRDYLFRFSTGIYYQPPFYKELKNLDGTINTNVKSQQSIHFVVGSDYNFKAWGDRPFKWTTELYYKHLNNLIPYQIDNVQIRYLPNQLANGYTAGIDTKIHGEFVKGIDSWASLSILSSQENIENDSYIDANGNTIEPGFIARPTDQRVNFSIFFQDYLPSNPSYKVHLNLVYGSGLPFGAFTTNRYEDTFRMPAYRRVDIGFSKQLKEKGAAKPNLLKHFTTGWVSLEVFNLLQTNNTISYLWIKGFDNNSFAAPNFLTSRRLNLKLIMEF